MSEMLHPGDLDPLYNDIYGEYLIDGGGEFLYDRFNMQEAVTNSLTTGRLNLQGFKCKRSEVVTKVFTMNGATLSVGGTIRRVGLYLRTPDKLSYNLVASIANDLTMWTVASSEYLRSFTASYRKLRGEEYLLGFLAVGGTMNNMVGPGQIALQAPANRRLNAPIRTAQLDGQADLPASFLVSSLTASLNVMTTCAALLP